MKQSKRFKKLILSIIALVVSIIVTAHGVHAWFVYFRSPVTEGSSFLIRAGIDIRVACSIDKETWLDSSTIVSFSDLFCGSGNKKTLYVRVVNGENREYKFDMRINSPDNAARGSETPLVITDGGVTMYHYLGSQIKIVDITATDGSGVFSDISSNLILPYSFLVNTAAQGAGQATYIDSAVSDIAAVQLLSNAVIPARGTIVFSIVFEFVDNGNDQSVYQDFSQEGREEACSRKITVLVKN